MCKNMMDFWKEYNNHIPDHFSNNAPLWSYFCIWSLLDLAFLKNDSASQLFVFGNILYFPSKCNPWGLRFNTSQPSLHGKWYLSPMYLDYQTWSLLKRQAMITLNGSLHCGGTLQITFELPYGCGRRTQRKWWGWSWAKGPNEGKFCTPQIQYKRWMESLWCMHHETRQTSEIDLLCPNGQTANTWSNFPHGNNPHSPGVGKSLCTSRIRSVISKHHGIPRLVQTIRSKWEDHNLCRGNTGGWLLGQVRWWWWATDMPKRLGVWNCFLGRWLWSKAWHVYQSVNDFGFHLPLFFTANYTSPETWTHCHFSLP